MNRGKITEFIRKNKVGVGIIGTLVAVGLISGIGYGVHKLNKQNDTKAMATSRAENQDNIQVTSDKSKVEDIKQEDNKKKSVNNGQAKKEEAKKEEAKKDEVKKEEIKKNENINSKEKITDIVLKETNNNDTKKDSNSKKQVEEKKETKKVVHKATPSKQSNKEKKQESQKQTGLAGMIASTKTAQKTNQIILVCGGEVSLWNKNNCKWNRALETSDRVGYGGMISASSKREGDGATPTGAYPILYGFGFGSNPGTSLEYKRITNNSYFVDDVKSKYYNQWYEGKGQKGEHMIDHPQYKYGIVIGYNTSHTPGKGSAIFLHCNGAGSTAGCVSVPISSMLSLLKQTHPGAYIIISSSQSNLKYY